MPAAAVCRLARSIRMKPPVSRLAVYRVEGDRRGGFDPHPADGVVGQLAGRRARQRGDIEPIDDARQRDRHRGRADLEQEIPARGRRGLVHPHDGGGEAARLDRAMARIDQQLAAHDVDVVGQRKRDRTAGRDLR
jgi:hypothetical protein